jgi:aminomethyltransferase
MIETESKVINKTILWDEHHSLGAKFTDFAGTNMPVNYGSQIEEHIAVRTDAGVFDVSHMAVIDITGPDVKNFLSIILTNDISKAYLNKAIYSCICNPKGGIIDDLIVYNLGSLNSDDNNDYNYRLVVNAGTWQKDLAWLQTQAKSKNFNVTIIKHDDLAILAVQGPNARSKAANLLPEDLATQVLALKHFECVLLKTKDGTDLFIARTGYTGEDGFEIILPNSQAVEFWRYLIKNNIKPCGLGARDTLRLEAGMSLYGAEMDETTSPVESGLLWTVALNPVRRDFIGRAAIEQLQANEVESDIKTKMVGIILESRGVLRHGMEVVIKVANHLDSAAKVSKVGASGDTIGNGIITSGTYSPSLQCSIALARIKINNNWHDMGGLSDLNNLNCEVIIRNKFEPVRIVTYPFVRFNKAVYK